MYEFLVILDSGKTEKVVAENITGVMKHFDEDEVTILNIFREAKVSQIPERSRVTITTEPNPEISVATGCKTFPASLDVKEGTEICISAIPGDGWYFDHWQLNGEKVSDAQTYLITAGNEDAEYQAVFVLDKPEQL